VALSTSTFDTLSWASLSARVGQASASWMRTVALSSATVASWVEVTTTQTVAAWAASATTVASRARITSSCDLATSVVA
jgi:hypothetical protein